MSKFKHTFDDSTQESFEANGVSGWRPAIAMPYFVGFGLKKSKCRCGRVFKTEEDFKAHYIYRAVWENESGWIPKILADAQRAGRLANELESYAITNEEKGENRA